MTKLYDTFMVVSFILAVLLNELTLIRVFIIQTFGFLFEHTLNKFSKNNTKNFCVVF